MHFKHYIWAHLPHGFASPLLTHVCVVALDLYHRNDSICPEPWMLGTVSQAAENLRGAPYLLPLEEITRRTAEAAQRGATEVCMQVRRTRANATVQAWNQRAALVAGPCCCT